MGDVLLSHCHIVCILQVESLLNVEVNRACLAHGWIELHRCAYNGIFKAIYIFVLGLLHHTYGLQTNALELFDCKYVNNVFHSVTVGTFHQLGQGHEEFGLLDHKSHHLQLFLKFDRW